jgi:catechol 2,3-dioxygenase-like lactoylglutathione lyase family enzyme
MTTTEPTPAGTPALHHLGVETSDMANSIAWYQDFFGAKVSWELETFSELTRSRLPGITRLCELVAEPLRFHVFSRTVDYARPAADMSQFQHVCLHVASRETLRRWRERWFETHDSGRHTFARDEPATEIVVDAGGVSSFYAYDVNGLEFEFTNVPDVTA